MRGGLGVRAVSAMSATMKKPMALSIKNSTATWQDAIFSSRSFEFFLGQALRSRQRWPQDALLSGE